MTGRAAAALAGALLATFLAGTCAGRALAPVREVFVQDGALAEREVERVEVAAAELRHEEPVQVRTVTRWRTPSCPGQPPTEVEEERTEQRGAVETAKTASTRTETASERVSTLRTTVDRSSPPRASWAISGGAVLLPGRAAVLGLGHRLAGPVWLEVQAQQPLELAPPALALGIRVEW